MENCNSNAQKISSDQQSARMLNQAIKDDQGLSAVAGDIQVTVKDGAITLDGEVSTQQQMNLATNTATAIGKVDEINNRMVIKGESSVKDSFREYQETKKEHPPKDLTQESAEALSRADDDGFAVHEKFKDDHLLFSRPLSLKNLQLFSPMIFKDFSYRRVMRT
jgi:S-adenosylmethionine synthetase